MRFESKKELLKYAETFINTRWKAFLNDIGLCLLPGTLENNRLYVKDLNAQTTNPGNTEYFLSARGLLSPDEKGVYLQNALFPSVLLCCSMLELLSGLFAGNLSTPNTSKDDKLKKTSNFSVYANKYMGYEHEISDLVILIFRHKISHMTIPSDIIILNYDIELPASQLVLKKGSRISWIVSTGNFAPHLAVAEHDSSTSKIIGAPWPVTTEYSLSIDIETFINDLYNSIYGKKGFLHDLKTSYPMQAKFEQAMAHIFPA